MVYQNKFVAVIKAGGKVLRETSGTVTIPFGSEYSIYLKNLNSVRVKCKVSVDGQDATEGAWLVIAANGSLELERFIRNGNFDRGNRFKFIERTAAVEAHRGIGAEDGLVRVEYKTELVTRTETLITKHIVEHEEDWHRPYIPTHPWPRPRPYPGFPYGRPQGCAGSPMKMSGSPGSRKLRSPVSSRTMKMRSTQDASIADCAEGITVPGSESNQRFVYTDSFPTQEPSEVIVLKLRGAYEGKPVTQPVTVEHKPKCETCGKVNKADASFCSRCGTALTIIR